MALYGYQALSKEGKHIRGTLDASSSSAAAAQLIAMGLYPVRVEKAEAGTNISLWKRLTARSVSHKEKILFTKQLAILLGSGVPLLQALELLSEHMEGQFKTMLVSLKDSIKEGQSFADALKSFPRVFDTTYIQLVRAGEATGKLSMILQRLVVYLERREAIVKRVKSAMTYPMIQLSVVVLVVCILLYAVVPGLAQNFAQKKVALPWPTAVLMAMSNAVRSYWYILIGVVLLLVVAFISWKKTVQGQRTIDTIKLKLPIVSFFTRMGSVVQFSRTLGMLIESGVNLPEALDIVVQIVDNRILKDALSKARDKIIKEGKISTYLEQTKLFPSIAIYLIKTGEESGKLDTMLLTVAQNYEDELTEYSDTLSTLLEPIMLLLMAVIVGFIVFAIALPMMQQSQLINM